MDGLDVEILQALTWKSSDPVHASRGILRPWDIARKVGVHGNTVKNRMADLREEGVLKGVYLIPQDSEQVGLRSALCRFCFETPADKREGVATVEELDPVFDVYEFVGTDAWIGIKFDKPKRLEDELSMLENASGAREVEAFYDRGYQDSDGEFSDLDLRIVRELMSDALQPFVDVADTVGVTPRTVRSRFHDMVDAGLVFVFPHIDLGAAKGRVPYAIEIGFDSEASQTVRKRMIEGFPHAISRSGSAQDSAYLLLCGETAAQAEDDQARLLDIEGLHSARVRFLRRSAWHLDGVRRRIEAMIGEETKA